MRKVLVILLALGLSGCYAMRPEMYQARIAYYQAQTAAYEAMAAKGNAPLVAMTTVSGETITVANPIPAAPPVIREERNAWVDFWKATVSSTALSIFAGGWSASQLLKNSSGDVNIKGDGNTASPVSNSYNSHTSEVSSAGGDGATVDKGQDSSSHDASDHSVFTDSSNHSVDNSDNSVDNSDHSVFTDNRNNFNNQTAKPYVVDPVVVNPVIVNPVVVTNE